MDERLRRKERKNAAFNRTELGALLRLFSSLGITVAFGIVGSFFLGLYVESKLAASGFASGGTVRAAILLLGVGLSVYWAYLRIGRHLAEFDPVEPEDTMENNDAADPP